MLSFNKNRTCVYDWIPYAQVLLLCFHNLSCSFTHGSIATIRLFPSAPLTTLTGSLKARSTLLRYLLLNSCSCQSHLLHIYHFSTNPNSAMLQFRCRKNFKLVKKVGGFEFWIVIIQKIWTVLIQEIFYLVLSRFSGYYFLLFHLFFSFGLLSVQLSN